jgi:predicted O-methyltransferase YrrM
MKFDEIADILKGIPYTRPRQGKILFDFVCETGSKNILELGCAHGVSTCYLAAALDECGKGSVLTMDFQSAREFVPNIFTLLEQTNLSQYVTPILSESSYTWSLMKLIEQQTKGSVCHPCFDFCFIDGGHLWEEDGFAFFLVEKLLVPGGWILFDDVYWTYADDIKNSDLIETVPKEQRYVSQIERVFSLLVCQHPNFENPVIREKWGWAQKREADVDVKKRNVVREIYREQGFLYDLIAMLNKLRYRNILKRARKRNR